MDLYTLVLLISSLTYIAFSERYELEFLHSDIFSTCEGYPDNSIHSLFDMSNVSLEQSEDGSIIAKGYSILKKSVDAPAPFSMEIYKKQRGAWQPTVYTQKRQDTCTACFDRSEVWYSYLKDTPEVQLTCPFQKGQRLDFNINEPTYLYLPPLASEGEYKLRFEAGDPNGDFYLCVDIFGTIYKA